MSAAVSPLLAHLPNCRGRYVSGQALAEITWFRVGGPAEILFMPADPEDLQFFLAHRPTEVPLTILGAGSNVLVRDGGIPGVTVRLGKGFNDIRVADDGTVTAGAGALDVAVARKAAQMGRDGLSFFSGIPGTIGGALAMNAGAYGGETRDRLIAATAFTLAGEERILSAADMGLSYRSNPMAPELVFVSATFATDAGDPDTIQKAMQDIAEQRGASQPIRSRTGGSTFKNPAGTCPDGPKAWKLIDAAGCRGLAQGEAQVSPQHCNFLINHGQASAADLESLGEAVRARVLENSGVALDWEIKRLGVAL